MKAASRSSRPGLTEKRSAEMMEIKWGGRGDESPSCENMNEVHLANQDQLLSLECCAACTRQPIQSQKATLWQGPTLFLVVRSSLLELSTNYQWCLLVINLPKCSWSSSCVLRRGSHAHGPSSKLRPGNIFSQSHQWSTKDASNDHCTKM